MRNMRTLVALAVLAAVPVIGMRSALAETAEPLGALAKMPVREITVFKDGHAFVLHTGTMPTDAKGNVALDYLPQPVLGTFWPYAGEKSPAKLSAVTTSQRKVLVERTALTLREMLESNPGAEVYVKEYPEINPAVGTPGVAGSEYPATILGIPERTGAELEATSVPNSGPQLPQKAGVILLKTDKGTRVVDISRIAQVTFKGEQKRTVANEEMRNLMTMKLEWPSNKPEKQADVGMVYLQKGIRWIPNYRIEIDGKGEAAVKLQATLVNELTDLEDVTANLVIGVPTFAFKDTRDPIALEQAVAQLSQHFRVDSSSRYALSNAIMSQTAGAMADRSGGEGGGVPTVAPIDLGPEVSGSKKNEDLYVFTVSHVSLKKGARMALPVTQFKLKYRDVYTLDIPFTPPPEVWRSWDVNRQSEIARLMNAPKFEHKLRLTNKSDYPLTTAPALILRDGKLLAQAMMTYTGIGGDNDLPLTTAVDIKVTKSDHEAKRTPKDAVVDRFEDGRTGRLVDRYELTRIDLDGSIKIVNHRGTPVDLEVTRNILGKLDKADNDGKVEMINQFEDKSFLPTSYDASEAPYPSWWTWYAWPYWWNRYNGVGKATWKVTVQPDKEVELGYQWHYHW